MSAAKKLDLFTGFEKLEKYVQTRHSVIYRGWSARHNCAVIIKMLSEEFPRPKDISTLKKEYDFQSSGDLTCSPRALEFHEVENKYFVVFEDVGGESLAIRYKNKKLSVGDFLTLGEKIATGVNQLHLRRIVHQDIKPDNIIVHPITNEPYIIDFGSAMFVGTEGTISQAELEGTIQYISPEQTGRTKKSVDFRTDVYSLGITLYELLVGEPPFKSSDPAEMIHFHLAVRPQPVHVVRPDVPEVISAIIDKMIAKEPDERYASFTGVIDDLQQALKQWNATGKIEKFQIATQDISNRFTIPNKLYGREAEIATIRAAFGDLKNGLAQTLFVKGDPGIGKSALIAQLQPLIVRENGIFVSGKFDQYFRDLPMSALLQAFDQLIDQLLGQNLFDIEEWKTAILSRLEKRAASLVKILPRLATIVGEVEPENELDHNESKQRQISALKDLLRVFSQHSPLVFFIDDVQWSDIGTRQFLADVLTDPSMSRVLFVLAYRSNELATSPILQMLLKDLNQARLKYHEITLGPISSTAIGSLLADVLHRPFQDIEGLARLVENKTAGNPFFVHQLLKNLYEKNLFYFKGIEGWHFDLTEIATLQISDNVVSLMIGKIDSLEAHTKKTLQAAACFGCRFSKKDILTFSDQTPEGLEAVLFELVTLGFIISMNSDRFKFAHDKIQEAAYKTLSSEHVTEIHLTVARRLLKDTPTERLDDVLFDCVRHYNSTSFDDLPADERRHVAELDLKAAQKAAALTLHDLVVQIARRGLQAWQGPAFESTGYALNLELATSSFIIGDLDTSEKIFEELKHKTPNKIEKAKIYDVVSKLKHTRGLQQDAITEGLMSLRLLGVNLPAKPSKLHVLFTLLKTQRKLKKFGVRNITKIPSQTDEVAILINDFHHTVGAPSYFVNKNMFALTIANSTARSLTGISSGIPSVLTFYATVIAHKLGEWEMAFELTEAAHELSKRYPWTTLYGKATYVYAGMLDHWKHPISRSLRILEDVYLRLKQVGEVSAKNYCNLYIPAMELEYGYPLDGVEKDLEKHMTDTAQSKDQMIYDCAVPTWLATQYLTKNGEALRQGIFRFLHDSSEENFLTRIQQGETANPVGWYGVHLLWAHYILGDYEQAAKMIVPSKVFPQATPYAFAMIMHHTFLSLLHLARLHTFTPSEKRRALKEVNASLRQLKKWVDVSTANSLPQYLLLQAEYTFIVKNDHITAMRLFEQASDEASVRGMLYIHALACERAAHMFEKLGNLKVADFYERKALAGYERWGAHAKVERLREKNLLSKKASNTTLTKTLSATTRRLSSATISGSSSWTSDTNALTHLSAELDMNAIVKATSSISAEIEMKKLVDRLLRVLVENAGAERGVFFVQENDILVEKAECKGQTETVELYSKAFTTSKNIPLSVVSYVLRTKESVVIADAVQDHRFSNDEYVREHKVKSVLCMPILRQGQLAAVVYLENNAATETFTQDRIETLTVLSSQAAISIENAKLYEESVEKARMQSELKTAQTVQETLFPANEGTLGDLQISGHYEPASECGGDWWYYNLAGQKTCLWIADATGHGAPAALLTSAARSAASVLESFGDIDLVRATQSWNKAIHDTSKGRMYMTGILAAYDPHKQTLAYCNASHEPPILITKDLLDEIRARATDKKAITFREFRQRLKYLLDANGPRLGQAQKPEFVAAEQTLAPGDIVFFYTDGVLDLVNTEQEQLTERRLLQILFNSLKINSEPEAIKKFVVAELEKHREQTPLVDDVTLFFCQRKIDKSSQ